MDQINCSLSNSGEDQYISLDVSKDSDEDLVKRVRKKYEAKAKLGMDQVGYACTSISKNHESLLKHAAVEVSNDAKNVSEAVLGSCEEYYYNDTSFIGLPPPPELSNRLKAAKVREKLEVEIGSKTVRFFLAFMIKAELNLIYTGAEVVLTLIVVIASFQGIFATLTIFGAFVGSLALLTSLNLLHYWYGFSRYATCLDGIDKGVLSGHAIDHRFEQIRDICSSHANGDYRRRTQAMQIVLTLPLTFWYHLSTCVAFVWTWIAKKVSSNPNETQYAPSFWGIVLTNIVFTWLWLFGGPVWVGLMMLNLVVQQRLYSSLLCRRGLRDFVFSLVFGHLIAVQTGTTVDDLLERVDKSCVSDNTICATIPSRGKVADENSYDPPSLGLASSDSMDSSSDDLESGLGTSSKSDSIHSRSTQSRSVHSRSAHSKSAHSKSSNRTEDSDIQDFDAEGLTYVSDDFDERLELLNEVSVMDDIHTISPKNAKDVYFGVETHEGTQVWNQTILEARQQFSSDAYTEREHAWIMEQLEGRQFYALKDSSRWVRAGEDTIRAKGRTIFSKQVTTQENASFGDTAVSTWDSEDENTLQTTKSRFSWRLKSMRKSGSKRKSWKNWVRSRHSPRNRELEEPTDIVTIHESYWGAPGMVLGQDNNSAFVEFKEVVKEAAEKYYPMDYNNTVHRFVLDRVGMQRVSRETPDGGLRPASGMELREEATEHYNFNKERLKLVEYLLKEVDVEMADVQDDVDDSKEAFRNNSTDRSRRSDRPQSSAVQNDASVHLANLDRRGTPSSDESGTNDSATQSANVTADNRAEAEGASVEVVPKGMKPQINQESRIYENIMMILSTEFFSMPGDADDASTVASVNNESTSLEQTDNTDEKPKKRETVSDTNSQSLSQRPTKEKKPLSRKKKLKNLVKRALKRKSKSSSDKIDKSADENLDDVALIRTISKAIVEEVKESDSVMDAAGNHKKSPAENEQSLYDNILAALTTMIEPGAAAEVRDTDTKDKKSVGVKDCSVPADGSTTEGSIEVVPKWMKAPVNGYMEREEQIVNHLMAILSPEFFNMKQDSGGDESTIGSINSDMNDDSSVSESSFSSSGSSRRRHRNSKGRRSRWRKRKSRTTDEKPKRPRSRFVLNLLKKAVKRKGRSKTKQEEKNGRLSFDTAELERGLSNGILDDNSIVDDEPAVAEPIPEPPKSPSIYDSILSVLTNEFLNDPSATGTTKEGEGVSPSKQNRSGQDPTGQISNRSKPEGAALADEETASVDTKSLFEYVAQSLQKEEEAPCESLCGATETSDEEVGQKSMKSDIGDGDLQNEGSIPDIRLINSGTTAGITSQVHDRYAYGDLQNEGSIQDIRLINSGTTAGVTSQAHDRYACAGEKEEESTLGHSAVARGPTAQEIEEEETMGLSIEVQARVQATSWLHRSPKVVRTIVHIPHTTPPKREESERDLGSPASTITVGASSETSEKDSTEAHIESNNSTTNQEGNQAHTHQEVQQTATMDTDKRLAESSIEVEAYEMPTTPLPKSPKVLCDVVHEAGDEEQGKTRKMMSPKTYSAQSLAFFPEDEDGPAAPIFFSRDEEGAEPNATKPQAPALPSLSQDSLEGAKHIQTNASSPRDTGSAIAKQNSRSIRRRRKFMLPKTLVMKDIVSNENDYVRPEMLPPEENEPQSAALSPIAAVHHAVEYSTEQQQDIEVSPSMEQLEKILSRQQGGMRSDSPSGEKSAKKRMMPKTLKLRDLDDSARIKRWIAEESNSKKTKSKLFSSLWKRAASKKTNQKNDGAQYETRDERSSKPITSRSQGRHSTGRVDDNEAMYSHLMTILEDDYIRDSGASSSQSEGEAPGLVSIKVYTRDGVDPSAQKGKDGRELFDPSERQEDDVFVYEDDDEDEYDTRPSEKIAHRQHISSDTRSVDDSALYQYIVHKLEEENSYNERDDESREARVPVNQQRDRFEC